ncbi:hypothetical protein D8B45_08340 [Candidatus Gracilibacteria bacterium]|nr:MAG: hypothetical protein D8B45_08340 [Candidatus Gracilibacteria bacterium]
MKKVLGLFLVGISFLGLYSFANLDRTQNNLHIIPQTSYTKQDTSNIIKNIGDIEQGGTVLERYSGAAAELEQKGDLGAAFETGVFSWNIVISYLVYLLRFISQLGLLIGAVMILYAGYQYATFIFGFGDPSKAKTTINRAIQGVLILVFSFAIWRGLTAMFL